MGLHNNLTDVSSDSLPLFLLAAVANAVCYLRSLIGISRYRSDDVDDDVMLKLADQLNLNRLLSYKYSSGVNPVDCDCVVCLNRLAGGEHVRKLTCQHVFHKECFDGWLDHLNFNCPLCRSPLVERVKVSRRRLTDDVIDWFAFRR